jgi:hypothetical protein
MTVIESKVKRSYWKNVALSAVPDLLVCWAAMKIMDGGAEVFFGTLIALQVLYLALWITQRVELVFVLDHQPLDDEQPH